MMSDGRWSFWYWLPASIEGLVLTRRQMLTHFPTVTKSTGFQPEPLLTAHCSLLIDHYSLLTTHCSLLIAHCSLLIAQCFIKKVRSIKDGAIHVITLLRNKTTGFTVDGKCISAKVLIQRQERKGFKICRQYKSLYARVKAEYNGIRVVHYPIWKKFQTEKL